MGIEPIANPLSPVEVRWSPAVVGLDICGCFVLQPGTGQCGFFFFHSWPQAFPPL